MRLGNVSRETNEMICAYVNLLLKWTKRINLIAPSTENSLWERHILDCVSAVQAIPVKNTSWLDVGSGGGLPGMIAAILHRESLRSCTLVESDQRKCAFLRSVARELSLDVRVEAKRIEETNLLTPNVLSARALAPLAKLLDLTSAYHTGTATFLFMKGRAWKKEVQEAEKHYSFFLEVRPSVTDKNSATLLLRDVKPHKERRNG